MSTDLKTWPDSELYRVAGILKCGRMLFARAPHIEAKIDGTIAALEAEIALRHPTTTIGASRER